MCSSDLQVKLRPHRRVAASIHGVGYNLQDTPSGSVGGTLGWNNIGGALDLFAEGDAFLYGSEDEDAADPITPGYAIYASGTGTYAAQGTEKPFTMKGRASAH